MPKDRSFPGYRWDAEGKPHRCETAADVDPAWTDYHPASLAENKPLPPPVVSAIPLTRVQVIAALQDRGIAFQRNGSTQSLYDKLVSAVERHEA